MERRPFLLGLFLLGIALAGTTSLRAADAPRPNIVFLLADDAGYGDFGCYGQQRIKTPNVDRLAAEGMRFTQFYAGATVCSPSRATLMTGLHNGHGWIRANDPKNIRPQDVVIPEVLKKAGYTTGIVGKWGIGVEGSDGVPNKKGFDFSYGYLNNHHAHNHYPSFLWRNGQKEMLPNVVPDELPTGAGVATKKVKYSDDLFGDEAVKFIEREGKADKPFFLYLAFTVPHANNEAKNKGMEVPDYGEYANTDWPEPQKGQAAMVTRMDMHVGRVLAKLKEMNLEEKTLVIFTSDNGPHREGGNNPDFNHSSGPLRGIKRDLTDGGIREPFVVRWPGKIKAGVTNDFVGFFGDMMPTFAELAG
jgi:arylsulfatase A-like enzyme